MDRYHGPIYDECVIYTLIYLIVHLLRIKFISIQTVSVLPYK